MIFLGYKNCKPERFNSDTTPTFQSHGERFDYVIGPFRTVRGLKAMAQWGNNNPHIRCVADAERIGKLYAHELV
jgi:hypothetical protein